MNALRPRHARPPGGSQAGFTLVELLIAMLLFGVVGSVVASAVISSFRSAAATNARIEATQELELAMQQISRDIRAASPLLPVPGRIDERLGATIRRDGEVRDVYYQVEVGDDGVQRLVREDSGRALVTSLNNGDDPVFSFYDRFGQPMSEAEVVALSPLQVQIRLVRTIEGARPAIVETRVAIRNLRHGEDS